MNSTPIKFRIISTKNWTLLQLSSKLFREKRTLLQLSSELFRLKNELSSELWHRLCRASIIIEYFTTLCRASISYDKPRRDHHGYHRQKLGLKRSYSTLCSPNSVSSRISYSEWLSRCYFRRKLPRSPMLDILISVQWKDANEFRWYIPTIIPPKPRDPHILTHVNS